MVYILLTLGAHARGLRYLVCVCVCLCVRQHESCHYAQWSVQPKVPTASAQSGKHFKYGVFSKNALFKSYGVKKPTSLGLIATSYGADGATFRQKFRQLVQGFCSLPYTFRYMLVNACAFSEPRARATDL